MIEPQNGNLTTQPGSTQHSEKRYSKPARLFPSHFSWGNSYIKKSKTGIRWLVSVDIVVNQTLALIADVFALEKKVAIATQLLNFNPTKNLDAALSTSLKGVTYTQQTLTCMKSTIETLEKGVKYVQS